MITDKQLQLIERLVQGEEPITHICKDLGVPTSTYYHWVKNNQAFQRAIDEAIELKVNEARKNIRINVNEYIGRLDNLSKTGKNEQAKVNAIAKIMNMGELDPQFEQEINIKGGNEETRNKMLEMLQQDKE